jgi:hypothetical protein
MKWLKLAGFFTEALLASVYFHQDCLMMGILWTMVAIIDGVMFVVRDNKIR